MKTDGKRTPSSISDASDSGASSLRYYDPEIQIMANEDAPFDPERFARAHAKSQKLLQAYYQQLQALAPRMSKKTFSFFADRRQPIFDADLLQFEFGDSFAPRRGRGIRYTGTHACAVFRDFGWKSEHTLNYRSVMALQVNVPKETEACLGITLGINRMDCLLWHELTDADGSLLQQSFLFASGATISILFKKVIWEKRRIE